MITHPPETPPTSPTALAPAPVSPGRPARRWRRRRWRVGAALALVALIVAAILLTRPQPAPPPTSAPTPAVLTAHGTILPAVRAQVGTQSGGVIKHLAVTPGADIQEHVEIARVDGPQGLEVITAPFAGTVTNVLAHTGDTILPGASIAVIADLHTLQVETSDVDQFLVGRLAIGMQVLVTIDAIDTPAVRGRVVSIARLTQPDGSGGQHYPVIVAVGGLPLDVQPGMSVRIAVPQ